MIAGPVAYMAAAGSSEPGLGSADPTLALRQARASYSCECEAAGAAVRLAFAPQAVRKSGQIAASPHLPNRRASRPGLRTGCAGAVAPLPVTPSVWGSGTRWVTSAGGRFS